MVTHDTKQSKGKEAIKETKLSNGTEIRELICVLSDIAITSAIDTAYIELLLADNCIVGECAVLSWVGTLSRAIEMYHSLCQRDWKWRVNQVVQRRFDEH